MATGPNVRELLLQFDANTELMLRKVRQVVSAVAGGAEAMDGSLGQVDRAFGRMGKSMDAAAHEIRARFDPMYEAQRRFDQEVTVAEKLLQRGAISQREYAAEVTRATTALQQHAAAIHGNSAAVEVAGTQLTRTARTADQMRGGMQQLSFQVNDVATMFALGARPMQIFASQGGQVIQTIQMMGGEGSKFLQFLGGPWGLALSTAAVLLVTLGSKLFEAGENVDDLVAKMREQAEQARLNERANAAWKNTMEGVTEALRENEEVLKQLREGQRSQAEQANINAQAAVHKIRLIRAETEALIANARARIEAERTRATGPTQAAEIASLRLADRQRSLDALEVTLAKQDAILAKAEHQLTESRSFLAVEQASRTAEDKINRQFNAEVESARKLAIANGTVTTSLYKQIEAINKRREAALEAARAEQRTGRDNNRQVGRQISGADADAILRGIGATVTSGARSPEHNRKVGGTANSYHLSDQARDIAKSAGMTLAKIKDAFAKAGVRLVEALDEGDHFHVAWGRRGQSPEAAQRKAASTAAKQVRNDNRFEETFEQLDGQLLAAKMELVEDTQQQAAYAAELVKAEQKRVETAIQNDVEEGKLTQAQADILKAKADEIAAQKLKTIEVRKQVELIREQAAADQQQREFQIEELRFQDEMALTREEHRRIQLAIIDALYAQKEAALKAALAEAEKAKNAAKAAEIQADLANLPRDRERAVARTERSTESPLDSWMRDASDMSDELAQLEVDGINGVVDSLVALSQGWDNMRQVALAAIQDIIQQLLRLMIMKAIANIAGTAAGVPGAGGGVPGGYTGVGAWGGLTQITPVTSLASGGRVAGPGSGTSDSIPAMLSDGEFVVNAKATSAFLPLLEQINSGRMRKLAAGGLVVPRITVPRPANINSRGGDTYHLNVAVGGPMSPRERRETGLQIAAAARAEMARSAKRGV